MQFCKSSLVSKQQLEPFYETFNHHPPTNPQPGSRDLPRENEIKVGATLWAPTSRGSVGVARTPFTQAASAQPLLPPAQGVPPPPAPVTGPLSETLLTPPGALLGPVTTVCLLGRGQGRPGLGARLGHQFMTSGRFLFLRQKGW